MSISDKAENITIKDRFKCAAADEQNHAVWFLFFHSKNPSATHAQRLIEDYGGYRSFKRFLFILTSNVDVCSTG
ncbi:hypothetical protein [Gracilibacillus boraciitolerans]|uniref:hypothetical protein n=1 Tax=Gracilibacillus boraciitolerans TaxID=307521 RepID=UPI0034E2D020